MIVLATIPDPSGGRAARAYAISFQRMNSYTGGSPLPPTSTGQASDSHPRSPSSRYSRRTAASCSSSWRKNPSTGSRRGEEVDHLLAELLLLGRERGVHDRWVLVAVIMALRRGSSYQTGSRFSANAVGPSLKSGWSQCIRSNAQAYSIACV